MDTLRSNIKTLEEKIADLETQRESLASSDSEESKAKLEEVNKEFTEATEQKNIFEDQLSEEESTELEPKYPPKVKNKDKMNIIMIGPEKCGKTTVANYLA